MKLKDLESINLKNCSLSDTDLAKFESFISKSEMELKRINLSNNQFSSIALARIVKKMAKFTNLEEIDFSSLEFES